MLFKRDKSKKIKGIVKCLAFCEERDIHYSINNNGTNTFMYRYAFTIAIPESLQNKKLYVYNENPNLYEIGRYVDIIYNMEDGSFVIK